MRLNDLSPVQIEQIKSLRYDQILEKHEGPFTWSSVLEYYKPEVMQIDGYDVMLPVSAEDHVHITPLRTLISTDGNVLTLFLKDKTYDPGPDTELFYCGRIAICEKMPGTQIYIATVYHEWFMVQNTWPE